MEAGLLISRREPPLRMVVRAPEPSVLRRRGDPCRHFGTPPEADRGSAPERSGCRGALLRARRECCCPGLRRKYGTGHGIRLRRHRSEEMRSSAPVPGQPA